MDENSGEKPTACGTCGATLQTINRNATEAMGHAKPVRVDWDLACSADASHPTVHWIEYP